MTGNDDNSCTTCKKTSPAVTLKRCAKCSTVPYCSRDCQKADWKAHKKVCGKSTSDGFARFSTLPSTATPSSPKGLDQPIAKPFTRLENGTWLHDRPEKDVYRLLIDVYRMRMEDLYTFEAHCEDDSLYVGAPHGLISFQRFMADVTTCRNGALLPAWWSKEKQKECEKMGMDQRKENWHSLSCCIEKSDVIEHYGDPLMPMQLRMFTEAIYGCSAGGFDGTQMRKMQMARENDGLDVCLVNMRP